MTEQLSPPTVCSFIVFFSLIGGARANTYRGVMRHANGIFRINLYALTKAETRAELPECTHKCLIAFPLYNLEEIDDVSS